LAVPFRANNTPAERAEFTDIDVAMLKTVLSFYQDGLSDAEFHETLARFSKVGPNRQDSLYGLWTSNLGDAAKDLPIHQHIDLHNAGHLRALKVGLKNNSEFINFFLEDLVFPFDSPQFPLSLKQSPWHLTSPDHPEGEIIGFSGTNDNNALLPSLIRPQPPKEASMEIRATNGTTIGWIQSRCALMKLSSDPKSGISPFADLLEFAAKKGVNAIIDTGALFRMPNLTMATLMLSALLSFSSKYKGVIFFSIENHRWEILDIQHKLTPRSSSTLLDSECMIYYDDPRTRGTDFKLPADARAILTLGPNLMKDKLIQGAGRMRRLNQKQQICIVGFSEVVEVAAPRHGPRTLPQQPLNSPEILNEVLNWTLHNTNVSLEGGIAQYVQHGLAFAAAIGGPTTPRVERIGLKEKYGGAFEERSAGDLLLPLIDRVEPRNETAASVLSHLSSLVQRNANVKIPIGCSAEEECEREIVQEVEVETITEMVVRDYLAVPQYMWKLNGDCRSPRSITLNNISIFPISKILPKSLRILNWDTTKLFVTPNFQELHKPSDKLPLFRSPFYLLIFASGDILLLTNFEASFVKSTLRSSPGAFDKELCLVPFSSLLYTQQYGYEGTLQSRIYPMSIPLRRVEIQIVSIAAVMLLYGEINFYFARAGWEELLSEDGKVSRRCVVAARNFLEKEREKFNTIDCSDIDKMLKNLPE
jgi:hypothetical protein